LGSILIARVLLAKIRIMGINILLKDESRVFFHFGEQVFQPVFFRAAVLKFTKQFFLGVRKIVEHIILVSLLHIGGSRESILENPFGLLFLL
jgi:hypothetical protein